MAVYMHAGRAVQTGVKFFFQAAEAVVVDAHVTEDLRGDLVVGIEALEFFLEVDAFHVKSFDGGGNLGRDAARDPGKVVAGGEARSDFRFGGERVFGIGVDERSECACGSLLVGDLTGIGVDGVDQHGHGQLAHVAVVEDAAARSDVESALLLFFSALNKVLVAHDLEPEEAAGDGAGPEQEEDADDKEARALEGNAARVCVRGCG